jgi:ubiquinone/menaquinone biosynthesis C-methylase UbiE
MRGGTSSESVVHCKASVPASPSQRSPWRWGSTIRVISRGTLSVPMALLRERWSSREPARARKNVQASDVLRSLVCPGAMRPHDPVRPYFLGEHPGELARLEFQAKAWRDVTLRLCMDAGIDTGHRVVDLGCGPGFLTFDLASMVGNDGHVVAVDKAQDFLSVLRARIEAEAVENVSVLEHDIEDAPLPGHDFDFVVARWLHPYVDDLEDLVAKELQCLKPGGRAVSMGTFNYQGACMAPWSDDFDLVTMRIIEFYALHGCRISAGNQVPSILCARGASIVSVRNVSQLAQPHEDLWEWYRQFSFSMLPRLLEAGLLRFGEMEAYVRVWEERARTPGAFISVPSHIGIVAQKPA